MPRDMVFISHANPEDNEFSRWLALRLGAEGYGVWCDLTQLLGGETFWTDIETAIRSRTAKFLFVLSRTSNVKPGPNKELTVAQNTARDLKLADFVIPLAIDDLPPREINIKLADINATPAHPSWAAGLALLLQKLAKDAVPKHPAFGVAAVAEWWREQSRIPLREEPEFYLSTWFPLRGLPADVWIHDFRGTPLPSEPLREPREFVLEASSEVAKAGAPPTPIRNLWEYPFACARIGSQLLSFASREDLRIRDSSVRSTSVPVANLLEEGSASHEVTHEQALNKIREILRVSWERMTDRKGLVRHQLANKHAARYFPLRVTKNRKGNVPFMDLTGRKTYRKLVGRYLGHYWHFALGARAELEPLPYFQVRTHVLFSDDGTSIWGSHGRLHSARRSACSDWWNDKWRDLLLASMQFLAVDQAEILIELSSIATLSVNAAPILFECPVSFDEPEAARFVEAADQETVDEP